MQMRISYINSSKCMRKPFIRSPLAFCDLGKSRGNASLEKALVIKASMNLKRLLGKKVNIYCS